MGHVFVSYAHADMSYVRTLVAFLEQAGLEVWADDEIAAGTRWSEVIEERIDSCDAFVLVMSPDAAASAWVGRELARALSAGRDILPLLLDGGVIFDLDHLQHETVHYRRMPSESFVRRLVAMTAGALAVRVPRRLVRHMVGQIPDAADCLQERPLDTQLAQSMAVGPAVPAAQILSGLGGVGKTQLAARVARDLRDRSGLEALVWVNARSRDAILSSYALAGQEIAGVDAADPERAAAAFLGWLAVTTGQWLVVLDDLTDPGDLASLWPPRSRSGRVVVTTRRRDAGLASHGQMLPVGLFTPQEARAYLEQKLADDPARLAEADLLAGDLGYLPLALAQAAAFIVDQDLTCAQYRRRFAEAALLVDVVPDPRAAPDDYHVTISATLAVSIDVADRMRPAGRARPLLTLLSLLDPNGVPDDLLSCAAAAPYLAGIGDLAARDADPSAALDCLVRLNLAEITQVGAAARQIRVHALVQRAARDQCGPGPLADAVRAAAEGIVEIWPQVESDAQREQTLRANVATLRDRAAAQLWAMDSCAVLATAGNSLGKSGQVTAATAFFRELVGEATAQLGPDHADTLNCRGDLGYWLGTGGDAAGSLAIQEALLTDRLRLRGPDHPDTLHSRGQRAFMLGEVGDVAGAIDAYRELLADQLRVLGPDNIDTINTRHNLAYWIGESGDQAEAAVLGEEVLSDLLRVLGPDHPDTLTMRRNLARWRRASGDAAGALAMAEALLPDYLRISGPDNLTTLILREDIAACKGFAGSPATAAAEIKALLADYLRVLGEDHPVTLDARRKLALWTGQSGDIPGAIDILEQLHSDVTRVLGADDPDVLRTRHDLADWQAQRGDTATAAPAFTALLADCLRVLGAEHPLTERVQAAAERWPASPAASCAPAVSP